jgi:hypothetical protein
MYPTAAATEGGDLEHWDLDHSTQGRILRKVVEKFLDIFDFDTLRPLLEHCTIGRFWTLTYSTR